MLPLGKLPLSSKILCNFEISIKPGKNIKIAPGSLVKQICFVNSYIRSNDSSSHFGFHNCSST